MIKYLFLILFFISYLSAGNINIAVAANVSYAIDDLIRAFNKKYPNIKVNITLGSSGKLTAQIKHGAPYDIFMAANMQYPNALYKSKIAITAPIVYAKGSLALLSNKQRSFKKNIEILNSKLVKRIAIANPKTAPYGKAAIQALKNRKIYNKVKSKLIYAESASATVSYTLLAADVGIVAKSLLYSKKMRRFKQNIHWIEIDNSLFTPIKQGMVILKNGKNNKDAKLFYDFILTKEAKDILIKYGYLVR